MKLRQIISGVLAFAITANSMVFFNTLSVSAEGRIPWEGYQGDVNFDTWDGTYDTSWFDNYEGTKEDPYIIDSAEAFMGIQKKAITENAATVSQLQPRQYWQIFGNLDYINSSYSKSYKAIPKNAAINDSHNWYSYIFKHIHASSIKYDITVVSEQQNVTVSGVSKTHYYAKQVFLNVTINGIVKTVDVTDLIKQCFPDSENNFLFNPVDGELYASYSSSMYNRAITSESQLKSVLNTVPWSISAPLDDDYVYVKGNSRNNNGYYSDYNSPSFNGWTIEDENALQLKIGTKSEFNIEFPTITATNSYDESIIIDKTNYKDFYLNVRADNISEIATETDISESEELKLLFLDNGTTRNGVTSYLSDTSYDENVLSDIYVPCTDLVDESLDDFVLVHSDSDLFYWQKSDSDIRFDKDREYYYIGGAIIGGYEEKAYYTFSSKITLSTNSIKIEIDCKDKDGNIVDTIVNTQSVSAGVYNLYKSFSLSVYVDSDKGLLSFTPYLRLARYYNGEYYTTSISLSQFTNSTFLVDNCVTIDNIGDFEICDSHGNVYSYDEIKSDLKFVGQSKSNLASHINVVKRNIYLEDTLPVLVAENDNDNPTFEGKYFKLTSDVVIQADNPVFPYCASGELGTSGLGGDFNLNGHVLCAGSTIFGNITESGRLHNGIVTTTREREDYFYIAPDNYGIIENITFISYNAFKGEFEKKVPCYFSNRNYGVMQHINMIASDGIYLCDYNFGNIKDMDILYAFTLISNVEDAYFYYFINSNYGIIQDVTVDTDADEISVLNYTHIIVHNYGVIDTFEVKDFSVNGNYQPISQVYGGSVCDNLIYLYSVPEGYSSGTYILPYLNSCNENSISFRNLKLRGRYSTDVICYNGYGYGTGSFYFNPKFINADIDITVCKGTNYSWSLCGVFVDSNVQVICEDEVKETTQHQFYQFLAGNFINCNVYVDSVNTNSWWSEGALLSTGLTQDSYFHVGELKNASFLGGYNYNTLRIVRNCVFEVDNMVSTGVGSDSYTQYITTNITYHSYSVYDCDFIIKSYSGYTANNGLGGYLKDCRVWINFANEVTTYLDSNSSAYKNNGRGLYEDCEIYFTFDENAHGTVSSLLFGELAIEDTFVYIGEMPDTVYVSDISLLGINAGLNNLTVIAPKVNPDPKLPYFCLFSNMYITKYNNDGTLNCSSPSDGDNVCQNINVIANVTIPDDAEYNAVSIWGMISPYDIRYDALSNIFPIIHGLNATLNIYNEDGSDANVPVHCITMGNNCSDGRLNNFIFRSNSLSSYSSLFAMTSYNLDDINWLGEKGPLFWNCYLDLPNAQQEGVPSETANFATPGFVGVTGSGSDSYKNVYGKTSDDKRYLSSEWNYNNRIRYSRCYIPEGHSAVSTYFSSDESIPDSWGLTDDYEALPSGVSEISRDADTNGELAYMLDKGYAGVRRTYNWSVIEPDTVVYNSFNNEPLYTLPTITWGATHAIPDRCFDGDTNLNPVFKTKINEAEDGYIKAVGIGGSETTNGNIYVKKGAYIIEEAVPTKEEVILIYATQKLGDAPAVKIPDTPLETVSTFALGRNGTEGDITTYDISGYKQQGIDTVITPVFKTARYISVDIENPENGTIIPSAYVSAEGEKITIIIQTEKGYTINNIKVNGQSLTESSFFMPDEDVLITGECVPFEGGISSFSLFGIEGEIDQIAHTIDLTVPKSNYITNALPAIEYYGDYINPGTSTRVDFTNPVEYTVYYGDEQSVTYTVTVKQSDYTMKIYDFVINGVHGRIDQANRTISVGLPAETDLRNLVPDDIAYSAESITPTVNDARDFTVSQIYTLYTTDMTPVSYVVNVYAADNDTARLTKFVVSGYDGVINDNDLTVTLTVPEGLDLTNVVPDLIQYDGKKILPSKVTAVDLNTATYDVISQSDITNTYEVKINYISDNEAHIDKFVLAGKQGVIDQEAKTITVTLSKNVNVTGVAPDAVEYTGKSIYPSVTDIQDFTEEGITYTVVAADNTEVPYTVIIEWLENKADLLEFAILGYEGVIDQTAKTVVVTVPYGVDVSDTPPSKLVISPNATVVPTITVRQDFTEPVIYTVTSQDGLIVNPYTVTVNVTPPSSVAIITEFSIDDYEGVIDQDDGTITVTVPYDYPANELESKVPEITWLGEILTPDENSAQDFTEVVRYNVQAEDPDVSKDYDVIVMFGAAPDSTAIITKFFIDTYEGVIDQDAGTIVVTVPYDYPEENLESKIPAITWEGKTINPTDDSMQNFTNVVTYTVTAENPNISKSYDVTVVRDENPDFTAKITAFKIDEYPGVINQEEGTILVTVPYKFPDSELVNKVPDITWIGKTINPTDDSAQDFTRVIRYTVTAEDPTITKDYDVTVRHADPDKTAIITEFEIDDYPGVIDQDEGTITVTLPKDYPEDELKDKVPEIVWEGETINPEDDVPQDFTEPVKYTVTAEDPTVTKDYDVIIKYQNLDDTARILRFRIDTYEGVINQVTGTIIVTVPHDYPDVRLQNNVPYILWQGKTIVPSDTSAQDFTRPVWYTVTAQNPNVSKTYSVIVNREDAPIIPLDKTAKIIEFKIDKHPGVINQTTGEIVVTLPYDYPEKELEDKVPEIKWIGETLIPDEHDSQDFTEPVVYVVIAEDPSVKKFYDVVIKYESAPEDDTPEQEIPDDDVITEDEPDVVIDDEPDDDDSDVILEDEPPVPTGVVLGVAPFAASALAMFLTRKRKSKETNDNEK